MGSWSDDVPFVDEHLSTLEVLGLHFAQLGSTENVLARAVSANKGTQGRSLIAVSRKEPFSGKPEYVSVFDYYESLLPIRDAFVHGEVSVRQDKIEVAHYPSSLSRANQWGEDVPNEVVFARRQYLHKRLKDPALSAFPGLAEYIQHDLKNIKAVGVRQYFYTRETLMWHVWFWRLLATGAQRLVDGLPVFDSDRIDS